MNSFTATYYTTTHRSYQATILLSSVTLTIRYRDENNEQQEVHWLGKNISSLEERTIDSELLYHNNTGGTERLVIRDPALLQAVKKSFRHHAFAGSRSVRLFGSAWSKLLLVFSILFALLLAAYLWFIPWLGERVALKFSKAHEISLGEKMYQSILSTYTIDSGKTRILNEFYRQLQYKVDYPVQITVVKSTEVNAFAIPGGHIVVYDAILDNMKTPEELAALLGHEASHIALRHSLRNLFRSLARKMFLSVIVGSESGIAAVIVDNADNLKGLEYSRALETEADDHGLQLMTAGGIDPQGMLQLMTLLQKESGHAPTANFLSTHPVFDRRIDNIKKQLSLLPVVTTTNEKLKPLFHAIYENHTNAPADSW